MGLGPQTVIPGSPKGHVDLRVGDEASSRCRAPLSSGARLRAGAVLSADKRFSSATISRRQSIPRQNFRFIWAALDRGRLGRRSSVRENVAGPGQVGVRVDGIVSVPLGLLGRGVSERAPHGGCGTGECPHPCLLSRASPFGRPLVGSPRNCGDPYARLSRELHPSLEASRINLSESLLSGQNSA